MHRSTSRTRPRTPPALDSARPTQPVVASSRGKRRESNQASRQKLRRVPRGMDAPAVAGFGPGVPSRWLALSFCGPAPPDSGRLLSRGLPLVMLSGALGRTSSADRTPGRRPGALTCWARTRPTARPLARAWRCCSCCPARQPGQLPLDRPLEPAPTRSASILAPRGGRQQGDPGLRGHRRQSCGAGFAFVCQARGTKGPRPVTGHARW